MLATSARIVPGHRVGMVRVASALKTICSPSFFTSTFGSAARATVPSGPLTEIWPEATVELDAFRHGHGVFGDSRHGLYLRHDAGSRRRRRRRAPCGRSSRRASGQDRDAQAVHDARDVVAALVHAQPGLGHALQALDHRLAGVVLERDGELLVAAVLAQREVLDIASSLRTLAIAPSAWMPASPSPHARPSGRCGCGPACPRSGRSCSSISPYQLALMTPGTSPLSASRAACCGPGRTCGTRRAAAGQRAAVAQAHRRGVARQLAACRAPPRASSEARESWMISSSAVRLALNFSTVLRRFWSRSLSASLAMRSSVLERKAERRQQRPRLVVGSRRRGDGDVHSPQRVDLVVIDLGEDDLLLEAEVVVARPSKARFETPRKSRMRGIATFTSRSRNSYMRAPQRVTMQPTGSPRAP